MPGRELADGVAVSIGQCADCDDQAVARATRERRYGWLDLADIAHDEGGQFHSERGRHALDCGQLADPDRCEGIPENSRPGHAGCNLLEQLEPLDAQAVFEEANPVVLPPGRAKLATKPAPTGSNSPANTIGTTRV